MVETPDRHELAGVGLAINDSHEDGWIQPESAPQGRFVVLELTM